MARVVLVCGDESERTLLQACLKGHDIACLKTFRDAAKALTTAPPDLVIVRLDSKDSAGMETLRLMKRSQINAATIAVLPLRGTALESEAWQLGVRTYISLPIRYDDVRQAVETVLRESRRVAESGKEPPITEFERSANLSSLVNDLHKNMKCPAGSNRVLIRSVITGFGEKTEPRICLRCPIRQAVGLDEYVYYEHIRDHCTGKPQTCDAVIQYKRLKQAKG